MYRYFKLQTEKLSKALVHRWCEPVHRRCDRRCTDGSIFFFQILHRCGAGAVQVRQALVVASILSCFKHVMRRRKTVLDLEFDKFLKEMIVYYMPLNKFWVMKVDTCYSLLHNFIEASSAKPQILGPQCSSGSAMPMICSHFSASAIN
jgi:hypothetical protein